MSKERFAIIGFGNMGRALVRGVLKAGISTPDEITVTARRAETLSAAASEHSVQTTTDNASAVENANVVLLCIKPQNLDQVCSQLRGRITPDHLVVSVLAGKSTRTIEGLLRADGESTPIPVLRVMPNIPSMVDAGCAPFARGEHATDAHVDLITRLLSSLGTTVEIPEHLMDVVTGLSGSGPAYVYMVIEALTDGGVKMGLPREIALQLSTQTVLGAAQVVKETGLHPAILRDQVTTPGGTAIAAISDLEEKGLRPMLISAVMTATRRSAELSDA